MKPTLKSTEGLRKNSSSFCFEFLIDARSEDLAEHLWHHQTVQINNNVHHVSSVKSNIICSSVVKFKWLKNNGHYLPEMSLYIVNTSVFIPGRPFPGRPGFPDFFIPESPGMKTARFTGNPETANSRRCSIIVHYNGYMHGGFDCCCSSSVLVVRGEDEEHNVNTIPWRGPPPLSNCSLQAERGRLHLQLKLQACYVVLSRRHWSTRDKRQW